jgi:DNA-binding transcriptional LysR family regulator
MELRQLEYFIAVAEEASFTRAAGRVHISQSGVSAQIKQLERELGTTLFDRSARTAKLTAAGEAALGHARAALASAGALTDAVGELTSLSRGRVTVGMVVGCTITPFFDALAAFHRAYPGIEITVREGDSEQLTADMRRGTVDVALVGCAERVPENLCSFTIASEGLAALVPLDHPSPATRCPATAPRCAKSSGTASSACRVAPDCGLYSSRRAPRKVYNPSSLSRRALPTPSPT